MADSTQWQNFLKNARKFQRFVFCAQCGSNAVEDEGLGRLICRTCNNTAHWNSAKFHIADVKYMIGEAQLEAVLNGFQSRWNRGMDKAKAIREQGTTSDFDWRGDIIKEIEKFLDAISDSRIETKPHNEHEYDPDELRILQAAWQIVSEKVGATLESLKSED